MTRTYLCHVSNANASTTSRTFSAISARSAMKKARSAYPAALRIEIGWMGLGGLNVIQEWQREEASR